MKQRVLISLLSLLFVVPLGAESGGGEGQVSLSNIQLFLGSTGEGYLSARAPYDPKLQGQSRFSTGVRWTLNDHDNRWVPFFQLRGDLIYRGTSNLTGGYLYNGLDGGAAAVGGGVLFPKAETAPGGRGLSGLFPSGRFSLAGGVSGGLFGYTTGLNYFYYPTLFLEPSWDFSHLLVKSWGALGLRLALPLTWELRKDLDVSLGAGISLQLMYTLPKRRTP